MLLLRLWLLSMHDGQRAVGQLHQHAALLLLLLLGCREQHLLLLLLLLLLLGQVLLLRHVQHQLQSGGVHRLRVTQVAPEVECASCPDRYAAAAAARTAVGGSGGRAEVRRKVRIEGRLDETSGSTPATSASASAVKARLLLGSETAAPPALAGPRQALHPDGLRPLGCAAAARAAVLWLEAVQRHVGGTVPPHACR